MSDFVNWLDGWLLEIPELDKEHRDLVDMVNRLAQCRCPEEGAARPAAEVDVIAMLEDLSLHTRRHFQHEEAFMREVAYPRFEDHRYEHLTLLAEFAELLRDVKGTGLQCLDQRTMESLKGWLIGHIAGEDRRFGDYYRRLRNGVEGHGRGPFDRYWTRRAGHH